MNKPNYIKDTIDSYTLSSILNTLDGNLRNTDIEFHPIKYKYVYTNGINGLFYIKNKEIFNISMLMEIRHFKDNTNNIPTISNIVDYMKENNYITKYSIFNAPLKKEFGTNMMSVDNIDFDYVRKNNDVELYDLKVLAGDLIGNKIVSVSDIYNYFIFKNKSTDIVVSNFNLKKVSSKYFYVDNLKLSEYEEKSDKSLYRLSVIKEEELNQEDIVELKIKEPMLNSPINFLKFKEISKNYITDTAEIITKTTKQKGNDFCLTIGEAKSIIDAKFNSINKVNIGDISSFMKYMEEFCEQKYLQKNMIVEYDKVYIGIDVNNLYSSISHIGLNSLLTYKGKYNERYITDDENNYFFNYSSKNKLKLISVAQSLGIGLDFTINSFGKTFADIMDLIYKISYIEPEDLAELESNECKIKQSFFIYNINILIKSILFTNTYFSKPQYIKTFTTMSILSPWLVAKNISFNIQNIVIPEYIKIKDNLFLLNPFINIKKVDSVVRNILIPFSPGCRRALTSLNKTIYSFYMCPEVSNSEVNTITGDNVFVAAYKICNNNSIDPDGFSIKEGELFRNVNYEAEKIVKVLQQFTKVPVSFKIDFSNITTVCKYPIDLEKTIIPNNYLDVFINSNNHLGNKHDSNKKDVNCNSAEICVVNKKEVSIKEMEMAQKIQHKAKKEKWCYNSELTCGIVMRSNQVCYPDGQMPTVGDEYYKIPAGKSVYIEKCETVKIVNGYIPIKVDKDSIDKVCFLKTDYSELIVLDFNNCSKCDKKTIEYVDVDINNKNSIVYWLGNSFIVENKNLQNKIICRCANPSFVLNPDLFFVIENGDLEKFQKPPSFYLPSNIINAMKGIVGLEFGSVFTNRAFTIRLPDFNETIYIKTFGSEKINHNNNIPAGNQKADLYDPNCILRDICELDDITGDKTNLTNINSIFNNSLSYKSTTELANYKDNIGLDTKESISVDDVEGFGLPVNIEKTIPSIFTALLDVVFDYTIKKKDENIITIKSKDIWVKVPVVFGVINTVTNNENECLLAKYSTSDEIIENLPDFTNKKTYADSFKGIVAEYIDEHKYYVNLDEVVENIKTKLGVTELVDDITPSKLENNDSVLMLKGAKIFTSKLIVKAVTGDLAQPYAIIPIDNKSLYIEQYDRESKKLVVKFANNIFADKGVYPLSITS